MGSLSSFESHILEMIIRGRSRKQSSIHCEGETNTLTAGPAAAVIVKVYQETVSCIYK